MPEISKIALPSGDTYDIKDPVARVTIPFGKVNSTSTATVFTATVPGITELYDGVCVYLRNGVITSASGYTININGLGAKPVYSSMSATTRTTTIFNANYTMLFIYNSTRVTGGCWDIYYGYYSDSNSVGYQLRSNNSSLPVSGTTYRYRLLFTSKEGTHYVPANTSTSTSATAKKDVNQSKINPFGDIRYYSTTTALSADETPGLSTVWQQYNAVLGYSFNRTGSALTLTVNAPVYLKCAPQSDGSAIIDADQPFVQALPTSVDNKIYIFLGVASSVTNLELLCSHPIYEYKNGAVRMWTNSSIDASSVNGHTVDSDVPSNAVFTDTTYSLATTTTDGLMSSSDKEILSNIATLAEIQNYINT